MTVAQVREHSEYKVCMDKIKSYPTDFEFTLNWQRIPKPQANALRIVMEDACKEGLLDITSIGLALDGSETDRTYKKL